MAFKENFERGEKESLDYDDSAFYYFCLALLLTFLIPATWYQLVKPILFGDVAINYGLKNCQCTECKARLAKRSKLYRFSWLNTGFIMRFTLLAFMWFLCYKCFDIVKDLEPLKTFVPNEILGVEPDATVA